MRLTAIAQIAVACLLLATIVYGRSVSNFAPLSGASETLHWSPNQQLLDRAWAGAVPGIAADAAVLEIFNIYARAKSQRGPNAPWRDQLYFALRRAQAMDPYFKDVYRLTEGLLGYVAQRWKQAVDILASSSSSLNSSDPLLAASFIAHQYLKNNVLAISLAKQAIEKPDVSGMAIAFATVLIKKHAGCRMALAFMESRLHTLPKQYRQGILERMRQYRRSKACIEEERRQASPSR